MLPMAQVWLFKQPASADDLDSALRAALAGGRVKDAAKAVAEQLGLPKNDVYARALVLKNG